VRERTSNVGNVTLLEPSCAHQCGLTGHGICKPGQKWKIFLEIGVVMFRDRDKFIGDLKIGCSVLPLMFSPSFLTRSFNFRSNGFTYRKRSN
jgi:hypothetical protein